MKRMSLTIGTIVLVLGMVVLATNRSTGNQSVQASVESYLFASQGQAPGWSRGQQSLALSYDDCVRRMPAALQGEGYGQDPNSGGNFVAGTKAIHTAVIICSPAPEARMLVQIVVASNGDGGGRERQCLQAQMEQPGASRCGATGNTNSNNCVNWTWAYAPAGQEPVVHGSDAVTICSNGTARDWRGSKATWQQSGNVITLTWESGNWDRLYLSADGRVMTGTNKDGWGVRGTRQ